MFDPMSRSRLNRHHRERFPESTLFGRIGRLVCEADCLPRKELFEAWEVARRVRRRFRGGRVVDLASGHGLLGILLLVLDDSSPQALLVDHRLPKSAAILLGAFEEAFPRLRGRLELREARLVEVPLAARDLVVASHACGPLTDQVIDRAVQVRARLAVLPCCHAAARSDTGGLEGWLPTDLAIDVMRAAHLRSAGYRIMTQQIPSTITPKNRLLLAQPAGSDSEQLTQLRDVEGSVHPRRH